MNTIYSTFFLLAVLATFTNASEDVCKQVTTFDAVCNKDGIIYMLSANPCYNVTAIGVTIIDTKNKTSFHTVTLSDIEKPIPINSRPGMGVIVEMHQKPAIHPHDYRKAQLHVMMYLVDIEKYRNNSSIETLLLEPYFYMFYDQCNEPHQGRDINTGFQPQPICNDSIRTGEYSTLCWVKKSNGKLEGGVYIILFDTCAVPYATNVLVFPDTTDELLKVYTGNKTDKFVGKKNGKCGLQMEMSPLDDPENYNVKLYYNCTSGDGYALMINDTFFNELGMICPLANCTTGGVNSLSQSCYVPWIHGEDEFGLLDIRTMHMNVTLDICKSNVEVLFTAYMLNSSYEFPYTVVETLRADHEDDLHDGGNAVILRLTKPPGTFGTPIPTNRDGYLYLDSGTISLYVHEAEDIGMVHVVLLRHYPSHSDAFPLLHTEFWVTRENVCTKERDSHKSLKIGLSVMVIVLVVLLLGVCYVCRKQKQRRKGLGLPSEVHLGEQELDDVHY